MSLIISLVLAAVLIYLTKRILATKKRPGPYPPGPKGLPFIGNALDFPTVDAAQEYTKWEKKYGSSILHASAFGTHVIFINKREEADDLFERRALKYSDRPHFPLAEMIGFGYNMAFMGYGEKWRLCRRISQQTFRQGSMSNFYPIITQKVHQALLGLLTDPENFVYHSKMLSVSVPMSVMYGYDVKTFDDPIVATANSSIKLCFKLIAPGGSIANILPFLRHLPPWLPGATSLKEVQTASKLTRDMQQIPLEFVKSEMAKGTAVPSFVGEFYEKKSTVGVSEEEEEAVLMIAPTVYAGGSDTIISTLGTFFYLMAVSPDVVRKAQAEIDHAIGSKRLPVLEDRPSLPYLEAIYREILRWKPAGPIGAPHCAAEDDFYKGYFIPKGATIIGNIWAMTHDESIYSEPDVFKPERFFNSDGSLNDDDRILAYGFGRRVCVGKHFASASLWLAITSILAAFNIDKARDESGKEIEIGNEYDDFGFLIHKRPFKCSIKPRSAVWQHLVEQTNADPGQ